MKVPVVFPDHVLRRMSKADRDKLGVAGLTAEECFQVAEAKSEKQLQNQIYSLLCRRGHRPIVQRMDRKSNLAIGMPDITFSVNGFTVYWEVKLPGKKPTDEQKRMMADLAAPPNNAFVRVIYTYREALDELQRIYHETKLEDAA